jgi:hypothetical protein
MTLKLERSLEGDRITIRLIGRVQSAHLDEISDQMARAGSEVGLDLEDVTIVDVEVVRFLGTCERNGNPLLHCPPYVREWISREGERS